MTNDIKITKGKAFSDTVRWKYASAIYKASTSVRML